jgi:glycosyltransferase involved in cell wall biosynthesis
MTKPKRKKVLYLITKSNWGGAQRYVYDLATHLDRERFEPVVALGGRGTLSEQLTHAGIRTISITSLERDVSLKKELAFARELWSILRAERPDILHVNSSKAGGVGTLLGRLARVPRVLFTAHGWAFNEDRPWWQKLIIKTLHWLTVVFSHKTIAVSHAIVEQLQWPLAHRRMKVIHPGRTIGAMYGKSEARSRIAEHAPGLKTHLRDPWILTIAELHPIKRLDVLVEAFRSVHTSFPNVRCVITGDGQERERLAALIRTHELTDHVFLTGPITEAARFLKAADLFVLPSKSESYGYVLHEAGLAGLPVLATEVGGIPDIVIHGTSGVLVAPDDPTALSTQIIDFLGHRTTWAAYGHTLQTAMQGRSVERMADATSALYSLPLD